MKPRTRQFVSLSVWLFALAGAVFLWLKNEERSLQLKGLVQTTVHRLSATENVVVDTVLVKPGDQVQMGQPLAKMRVDDLKAALDIARGRLFEISAAMEAESQAHLKALAQKRLALKSKQAQAMANGSNARAVSASQRAELSALTKQLKRLAQAEKAGVTALDALSNLKARKARLRTASKHNPGTVLSYQQLADTLRDAIKALDQEHSSTRIGTYRAQAKTQSKLINRLIERVEERTLKAPTSGQISAIKAASGDTIRPGMAVLEMTGRHSQLAIAYIPENQERRFRIGQRIGLKTLHATDPPEIIDGQVSSVGMSIVEITPRLWKRPTVPEFGRAVHIKLQTTRLLPGALVGTTSAPSSQPATQLSNRAPRVIQIPSALKEKTRMEISGAVWLEDLGQSLVVSDDTGIDGKNEDAPWVFWVDPNGKLAPEPAVIQGVDRVSDLESVTMAPSGVLYFLCSQSKSRHGKRPLKRQYLIRVKRAGHTLTSTGETTFYQFLKERLSPQEQATLGVDESLDIEGMTWWKKGLLIGLKSPLSGGRTARLWHLTGLDGMFNPGNSAASEDFQIRLVADVALPTGPDNEYGGISEMFAEGDQVYLLSTTLRGPEAGAAWTLNLKGNPKTPVRIAQWPGLKPEGLARISKSQFLVFFDRGGDQPMMTTLKTQAN